MSGASGGTGVLDRTENFQPAQQLYGGHVVSRSAWRLPCRTALVAQLEAVCCASRLLYCVEEDGRAVCLKRSDAVSDSNYHRHCNSIRARCGRIPERTWNALLGLNEYAVASFCVCSPLTQ